jgi:hypothetical protein
MYAEYRVTKNYVIQTQFSPDKAKKVETGGKEQLYILYRKLYKIKVK